MSILRVNQIKTVAGNTILNDTGNILQVQQTVKTDAFSSSSIFPVDCGLSCSITPTHETSKILVLWCLNTEGYGHYNFWLQRGGVEIIEGVQYSTQTSSTIHKYATTSNNVTYDIFMNGGQYLDFPATTSPITYKWQSANPYSGSYFHALNGVLYHNQDATYNARTPSILTLMEIS